MDPTNGDYPDPSLDPMMDVQFIRNMIFLEASGALGLFLVGYSSGGAFLQSCMHVLPGGIDLTIKGIGIYKNNPVQQWVTRDASGNPVFNFANQAKPVRLAYWYAQDDTVYQQDPPFLDSDATTDVWQNTYGPQTFVERRIRCGKLAGKGVRLFEGATLQLGVELADARAQDHAWSPCADETIDAFLSRP